MNMKSIEDRAKEWSGFKDSHSSIESVCLKNGYIRGAYSQREIDTNEFVDWLRNNWREYVDADADGAIRFGGWESDLRKHFNV